MHDRPVPSLITPQAAGPLRSLVPLYLGEGFILVANGIAFTAIAARALAAGLDSRAIGAAGSAFYAGLFAIYVAGPVLVGRFGLRTLALAAAPVTLGGLGMLVLAAPVAWYVGRFTMGVGIALLYVAMENWINVAVDKQSRGRALAVYMAVYLAAYATGQAVLLAVPATSTLALTIAAACLAAGLVAFARAVPPATAPPPPRPMTGVRQILRKAWIGILASLVSGLAAGAFYALGPVYALTIGMDPDRIAVFLIAVILGASVAQVVLGVASDRLDRSRVLVFLSVAAGMASVALCFATEASAIVFVLALTWGSAGLTGYAIAAALAYDAPHGRPPREVAQLVLVANGIGGIVGPALASGLDAVAPGKGLFLLSASVFAVLGLALLAARRGS